MPQDTTIVLDVSGENVTVTTYKDTYDSALTAEATAKGYNEVDKQKDDNIEITPAIQLVVMLALIYTVYKLHTWLEPIFQKLVGRYTYDDEILPQSVAQNPNALVYPGNQLNFSNEEITKVLIKYLPFYNQIEDNERERFLYRLKEFMAIKKFVIHDKSGFKEMPILISAAAIQLSFGLKKYLLPYFSVVNIYPEEFLGVHPTFRTLEGNVSGHTINLSWKHFLNGFKYPDDGQNIGLHELAHAYYYQYIEASVNVENGFVQSFHLFDDTGNKAWADESKPGDKLYSEYALKNFQEFWAESVELFFEKPVQLHTKYPHLYKALKEILNQDTLQFINPQNN